MAERQHKGSPSQRLLGFEESDFKDHSRNGRVEYYPCSEVLPGDGVVGPHEIAKKQHQALANNSFNSNSEARDLRVVNGSDQNPLRFELRRGKILLVGDLTASGEPFFNDLAFKRLTSEERYSVIGQFLIGQDLILNRNGRMHVIGHKSPAERRELIAKAHETLDALYYHFPRQTLTLMFQRMPQLVGLIASRKPIIDPRQDQWRDIALCWAKEHDHTHGELKIWISKIDARTHDSSHDYPLTAQRIASHISAHLGFGKTHGKSARVVG